MPKDFSEFSQKEANYSGYEIKNELKDPHAMNNNMTIDDIEKQITKTKRISQLINLLSSGALSLLTAPMITTQISLQLSILSHATRYNNFAEIEKNQIMNIPKDISSQDRRKYELIIKNRVTGFDKPFRPPTYKSYSDVFQTLANQGISGFYKGNFLGLLHLWINSSLRFTTANFLDSPKCSFYHEGGPVIQGITMVTLFSIIDIITHPIQTIQSRFILQNRLPNYRVYKSIKDFIKLKYKTPSTFMQGWQGQIPRNILFSLGLINFFKDRPKEGFIASHLAAHILTYPITTIIRRIQCQDNDPCMLEKRYKGIINAFKLIYQEEGIKGYYRGFLAFAVVVIILIL